MIVGIERQDVAYRYHLAAGALGSILFGVDVLVKLGVIEGSSLEFWGWFAIAPVFWAGAAVWHTLFMSLERRHDWRLIVLAGLALVIVGATAFEDALPLFVTVGVMYILLVLYVILALLSSLWWFFFLRARERLRECESK